MTKSFFWIKAVVLISVVLPGPVGASAQARGPVRPPDREVLDAQADNSPEDLGDAFMIHQRYQAALAAYQSKEPLSTDIWNKMGIANQLMFNPQEAIRCYRESLRLNPNNSNALNNLGTLYDSKKQFAEAARMFRKAIVIDPASALEYKNLGTSLLALGQYRKGWESYQKALALDPAIFRDQPALSVENSGTTRNRGAMNYFMAKGCVRAGMNDCAIDYLRRALNEGFTTVKKIGLDSEFAALRGLPAFNQLLAAQGR